MNNSHSATSIGARTGANLGQDRPVLVIGGTGKTGRRVVDRLTRSGSPVRVVSRSSATRFDWDDPATWQPALAGTRSAYVVAPDGPVEVARFAELAATAGLERLVLLSARQPDQGGDGVLPEVERALLAGAVPVTMLRPSWFVQNFTEGMFAPELAAGVLRLPVGDGLEPFIDADDIAEVAVVALTEAEHQGAVHELSGPALLTFAEAVDLVGRSMGRDLRFEPVDPADWTEAAGTYLPAPIVALLDNLFTGIRNGDNAHLSSGVSDVLGRPARSFERVLSAGSAMGQLLVPDQP
ncbi:Uncharacterized conserved protein YbjT, contains NAD(P)-binding and DUF2867 domains [Micromonospora phaseoli]|uniref:Uncharacterized conserved protein YbjT, contains NAD(P)-binding and DUF2867 domains n=1 Tax=Micromonospora phaseoli TaxID=1144548 RepID=A0A1H7E0D8_9ACTN|nr:NmrA family transcriptional regulator [Micromonospora phaseoli]PZW00514.1 uncharacterized protein YbjT (DUF2867 family) [Micromonospora phaseoli]GIJ81438.1 NmrA family transcriptional regulator [Micromonospora phaseoli]SEK07288.1 Uncharacterized conserved protein YbjT, contains NAD(P)-binding and DUF2867 domains [Micromonospora phaseoli]